MLFHCSLAIAPGHKPWRSGHTKSAAVKEAPCPACAEQLRKQYDKSESSLLDSIFEEDADAKANRRSG